MKIGYTLAIVAACGFMSAAAAQAGTMEQTGIKEKPIATGRSAVIIGRHHHPAVVIHRHHHPHPLIGHRHY